MTEIFVDADACPVKREILRVAERHGLVVHMVANGTVYLPPSPGLRRVLVPDTPDAADDWIAERVSEGDVAVTADILLAERCLDKGAAVLGPSGRAFDRHNIGNAVAMRSLNAMLRDQGTIRGTAPGFGKRERSRFLQALEETVRGLRRRDV